MNYYGTTIYQEKRCYTLAVSIKHKEYASINLISRIL
jgi:hypothetical protein